MILKFVNDYAWIIITILYLVYIFLLKKSDEYEETYGEPEIVYVDLDGVMADYDKAKEGKTEEEAINRSVNTITAVNVETITST